MVNQTQAHTLYLSFWKYGLIAAFIHIAIFPAHGQDSGQIWADLNYNHYFTKPLAVGGEVGYRLNFSDSGSSTLFVLPSTSYRFNAFFKLEAFAGIYHTWNASGPNSLEVRFAQAAHADWPQLRNVIFKHRLRLDQRYFSHSEDESGQLAAHWQHRLRYRLIAQTDYFNISENITNVFGLAFAEVFIPVADDQGTFSSRNRLGLGFGQLLKKNRHYEVHLFWQNSQGTDGSFRSDYWIIRLRFYLKTLGEF